MRHRTLIVIALTLTWLTAPAPGQPSSPDGRGPRNESRAPRQVQIDPETDEVLTTIKAAVSPSEAQMKQIVELYTKLRQEQRRVMGESMRGMRGRRGARDGGERPTREQMRQMRDAAAQKLEPMSVEFLAACRAVLEPDQLEGWDGCAAGLDLMPGRGGRGRGNGRGGPNEAAGPDEGDLAPAFELTDLDGRSVTLESLRGKPVVLEFGSYTCPAFRRQVAPIERIRRDLGDTVHWVLVYTKEAHPTDGRVVPLNTREGIEIPQHTSFQERLDSARQCKEKLDLRLRVLIDGYDNPATDVYGGAPNRGYVIDAEGKVVSKQVWIDPQRTREVLRTLLQPAS